MADQRITQLTALSKAGIASTDVLPIVDLSASETKKVTAKDLIAAGIDLVDAGEIDLAKLDQASSTKLGTTSLADGAVTYAKIQNISATDRLLGRSTAGAGSVEEITCTAAGRSLLDDATHADQRTTLGLGTIAIQDASNISISGGTISGATISGIADLAVADGGTGASTPAVARTNLGLAIGTDVQAYDAGLQSISGLTTAANQTIYTTGSDTYAVTGLTAAGRALLDDATSADQRTTLGLGSVATLDQVGTASLSDDAVTAAKLANESTVDLVTELPVSGAYTGQFALVTSTSKLYCWTGAQWESVKAGGSVNTITPGNTSVIDLTITANGDEVTIAAAPENTSNASEFLAGPTNSGGAVGYRTITAADIPAATNVARGAVIVNGEGLRMVGSAVQIDNDVTASGVDPLLVTYDAKGLITGGRAISSSDLPVSAIGSNGAVQPGTGLSVTGGGLLNHSNTVTPSTATKVSFDSEGHITSSQSLEAADIPSIDASKVISGTFGSARIADGAITPAKIADSGLTKVSGAGQFPQPDFLGQFLYSATGILYFAVGTSLSDYMWMPVNDQTSLNKQVRWGGTWNADTGKIATVTSFATQAGLAVDQDLPAPDENGVAGLYFICTTAGTGSGYAPVVPFDVGDWVLSLGTTWLRIDVITGGTGTLNAEQILLNPAVGSYVACQDAIAGLHTLTQIATATTLGVIKGSTSIAVDSVSGAASVDVIDEGTY